ncbi:MAG: N-acetylmuramoyl-L-alanine amidase CwlD [Firmicutes bacterium]|nr:N-acetylmuramoyl-L-alanine amidase CwlD [Bacillota bacterium]
MRVWLFTGKQVIWWALVCLTIGIYLGTAQGLWIPVFSGRPHRGISGRVIVIDAGHGGIDPGAVSGKGVLEKDITLEIAKELELLLKKAAVYVIMVRRGDYDLADSSEAHLLNRKRQDLIRRVTIAEEAKADLYISIHANYFPSPIWSGAQTFYYEGRLEDQRLAKDIQTELVKHLGPNNRLAKTGDFRVLRDTTMPAALVEVGFLSNPREAELLGQVGYQKRVAAAIFAGILRYYGDAVN